MTYMGEYYCGTDNSYESEHVKLSTDSWVEAADMEKVVGHRIERLEISGGGVWVFLSNGDSLNITQGGYGDCPLQVRLTNGDTSTVVYEDGGWVGRRSR